jgi:hypothetical protein
MLRKKAPLYARLFSRFGVNSARQLLRCSIALSRQLSRWV